ncbi:DUF1294 domain-containing protein [Oleiharenicola sp. Vm1]|uniref:DUF1294 domain-containing protein n=1 Tax=Oleiharenicola sp. Vm1 TaxID=3398393 RepID=UPI0039F484B0
MKKRSLDRLPGALLASAALLVLPGAAGWPVLERWGWTWLAWPGALSMVSFALYAFDKRRAERGGGRIPEAQLLAFDALGGWPGAVLAQQVLRHKTAKLGYQVAFWFIVLAHQAAAAWWLFG